MPAKPEASIEREDKIELEDKPDRIGARTGELLQQRAHEGEDRELPRHLQHRDHSAERHAIVMQA
jgi:hypothetical protein